MCPNVFATTLFWYNITTCKSHVSILYALEPATQRSISLNVYKRVKSNHFSSVQFSSSVVSDSLWPHELQPGLPVHHQPPEFTQTYVHRVGHAVQPSHPLSSPSPPAPPSLPISQSFSSHLFAWGGQRIGVKVIRYP